MKKSLLFMSAVCVVASASALDLHSLEHSQSVAETQQSVRSYAPRSLSYAKIQGSLNASTGLRTRADEDANVFYRPASNVWALGISTLGWGYQGVTFGFANYSADVVFENLSSGVSDFKWSFSQIGAYDETIKDFIYEESDADNLIIKRGFGEMATPSLASGSNEYFPDYVAEYISAPSVSYYFSPTEEKGTYGVSSYQNFGMKNPKGYTGQLTYDYFYNTLGESDPVTGAPLFNENGVYSGWLSELQGMAEGASVTDVAMENYTFFIPKPSTTYTMSMAWTALNVNAVAATQLISYIYPVDESGDIDDTPIAIGYAQIVNGENYMPVFEYFLLNEDGDELEEPIFIDSEVAITVEGFTGNPAITDMCPVVGFYPFSYSAYSAGNRDLFMAPSLYIRFSAKVDGNPATALLAGGMSFYYFNQIQNSDGSFVDPDTVTLLSYHQMTTDAVFPYMETIGGTDSIVIPEVGGEVTVGLDSYFGYISDYLEYGYYTLSAPEWLKVELKAMNEQTGINELTLSAGASEVGREGDVVIDGLGTKFTLHVVQGEGNAVTSISIDKNAEYFDLQGRRVANPDKGLYIKKSGNKSEKVIL